MALDRRLTSTVPALAKVISDADPSQQRRLAHTSVEFAYTASPHKEGAAETLAAIDAGQFGDSALRQWLRQQFQAAMVRSAQADTAGDHQAALAYNLHRHALAAAHYALLEDAEEAALEAAYEARFNAKPKERFDKIVEQICR
jgi:hypothetical protein